MHCNLTGDLKNWFGHFYQLEELELHSVSTDSNKEGTHSFIANKFPKLEKFLLKRNPVQHAIFHEFCSLNSQLRQLDIAIWPQDRYISAIAENMMNLRKLHLYIRVSVLELPNFTKDDLLEHTKLTNLEWLKLSSNKRIQSPFVGILMDGFATANISIEYLCIENVLIDSTNTPNICKLKHIHTLWFERFRSISESDLITFATELPLLRILYLHTPKFHCISISADSLIQLVNVEKKLEHIYMNWVGDLNIDENVFRTIVNNIQGRDMKKRLIMRFYGYPGTLNFVVPYQLTQSYLDKLQIEINFLR